MDRRDHPIDDEQQAETSDAHQSDPIDNQDVQIALLKRNTFTLEFPVLLLFFSYNLTSTVFQNQILFQTCLLYEDNNDTLCNDIVDDVIPDAPNIKQIDTYASYIFMARALLENIIPAFISFFIGPWSDKYGRKPILISTFFGYFLIYFMIAVISFLSTIWSVSPWYYLIAFIPISVLGGTCALITAIFCYITDISTREDRAFRMARIEAVVFVGLLLGALASNRMYAATSPTAIFICAATSIFIGLVYIWKYVKESLQVDSSDVSLSEKIRSLFDFGHVADIFQHSFKIREGYDRAIIWLTIIPLGLMIFAMEGSVTLCYLFMREKFGWLIDDYNNYAAINVIMQIIGNVFGTYVLTKMFGISDISMALIAFLSSMTEYIVDGFAVYSWEIYFGTTISLLKGVATPMCRSLIANIVPANEIGKIYSITTSIESLTPIGAAPLYVMIFNQTNETNPGAFNFISAAIYLICAVMMSMVYYLNKRRAIVPYAAVH